MSRNIPKYTIKQLLEAGAHFGHKSMRRNPKMAKYIHGIRNGVSIIDLNKTATMLYQSLNVVYDIAKNNGRILFVSTKKQGSDIVADAAKRCGQYYVNFRWLGGMLTNWKTVSQSIKTLRKIESQLAGEDGVEYSKKERLVLERQRQKLEQALGGIKNMGGYPDLVFIIDINKEEIAVKEAQKLGVPIMAVVDTNCDPDQVKYIIPGNDDSTKAIKLFSNLIADAAIAGIRENMVASGVDLSSVKSDELPEFALNKEEKKIAKTQDKKEEVKRDKKKIIFEADKKEEAPAAENAAEGSSKKKPAAKKTAAKKPAAKK